MPAKEAAKHVIDSLPDEASMDDIIHALYVTAKFEHGEREIRRGRGVPHAKARKRLQKWVR
jgi:predicted transcriptional regulator